MKSRDHSCNFGRLPHSLMVLCVALSVAFAAGAAEQEVLTNADVVAMVKAGLSASTITAKIGASRTAFDTDTQALIELAKQGVPDEVVRAMLQRTSTPAAPTAPSATASAQPIRAWTASPAKTIPRTIRFTMGERGFVYLLREYPEHGTIGACQASLFIDERELYVGPLNRCDAAKAFTLKWSDITSFCYQYDNVIPTVEVGRPWHGTLRVRTAWGEYLVGLRDREQFDEVRGLLQEYRGNIPEECPGGQPGVIVTNEGGFPLVHPHLQFQKGTWQACLGPLTIDEQSVRFEPLRKDCMAPLVIPWQQIDHFCFEDSTFIRTQFTFFGTNGEEYNFKAPGPREEMTLRTVHEQLVKHKPDAKARCE